VPRSAKAILSERGLSAKKSWGQNFLVDPEIPERIAKACGFSPDDVVVELGAGLGHLTRALAAEAFRVVAVERDRDLARILREEVAEVPSVEVVEANAVTLPFGPIAARAGRRLVVAGNLPYHLSSQILVHLLDERAHLRRLVLMLQKEVAVRIASPPGSREYGVLSVLCQHHADVRILFDVPRGAFHPQPKVQSSVMRFDLLEVPRHPVDEPLFRTVVHAAFAQRRKMVRNSLASGLRTAGLEISGEELDGALAEVGIDPRARAETLSVAELAALAHAVGQRRAG
jgi:16S rRNA (adenine1518-N6/adenine1519-N6)-dimethyltransferase